MQDYERRPPEDAVRRPVTESEEVHVTTRDRMRREREAAEAGERRLALPEALNIERDRVRWGPIWAGVLTAFTVLIFLSAVGLAIGLSTANPAALASGTETAGSAPAIWGSISAIISFLVGGFVAGRMASVFDRNWGAWNGAMVFFLALPLTLLLASQGLGFLAGALGDFASGVNPPTTSPTPGQLAAAADALRAGAIGTLIAIILGVASAAIGGAIGTRRSIDMEDTRARVTR